MNKLSLPKQMRLNKNEYTRLQRRRERIVAIIENLLDKRDSYLNEISLIDDAQQGLQTEMLHLVYEYENRR